MIMFCSSRVWLGRGLVTACYCKEICWQIHTDCYQQKLDFSKRNVWSWSMSPSSSSSLPSLPNTLWGSVFGGPPNTSWGSAFRGSKHLLTRYLEDFGRLGSIYLEPGVDRYLIYWQLRARGSKYIGNWKMRVTYHESPMFFFPSLKPNWWRSRISVSSGRSLGMGASSGIS